MRASRPGRAPVAVLGRCLGAATGAASALVLGWTPANAVDVNRMPPPPATPVEHHDPDPHTCNSERLLQAWSQQLQPFSDQPAAVLERLKLVQRDMAVVTLNRCIQRGLLSREQARQLAIRMGLEPQSPSQRP